MATIPLYGTQPGAVPSAPTGGVGGGQVRASPQMDIPSPGDPSQAQAAGAQLEAQAAETTAHAGAQLAQYGEQFADKYITAKLNVDAANRIADQSALLHQAEFESSKIADRDAAAADFDTRAGKIRDDFAAQDVNPKVRAAVDASLPNQIALRRASTQNAAFGLESQAQVAGLITNIDQYNKQAVDAQDPRLTEQLIAQANAAIDGRVAGGWLPADKAAKLKVDFGSGVYRTKIELAMQKDMRTGIALYQATASKLNAADARAMGVMAADRAKQVDAETAVSAGMPVFGQGGGGDIGAVRADTEKALGFPLTITSADRDAAHNAAVGGAEGSQHLVPGKALDISLAGLSDEQRNKVYQQFLSDPRVGGIGFYADHLHVDTRGGQRATWGTPPEAVAAQVKTWQATPAPNQAPTGDQLSQYKIDAYRYRQSIIDDLAMDPELKARRLQIIDQRLSTTNAIVLEQRKSAQDAAETAGLDLFTGKYKDGTFQQIADRFRAAGDTSNAAAYQILADRESEAKMLGTNPPAKMPVVGALLPGVAGRIAHQQVAEKAAEVQVNRVEYRRLSAEQEKIFDDGLVANEDPRLLVQNLTDAVRYAVAAGDIAKAQSLQAKLEGSLAGSQMAALPPAARERARADLQEIINNKGLTIREATALRVVEKMASKGQELWEKDPLTAASHVQTANGPVIALQQFDINMDPGTLKTWADQRLSDTTKATGLRNPNATNVETPFFTVTEMSDITQKLDHMRPLEAKQLLQKLAAAVPQQAISLIGAQMSKKDPVSDSYAVAMSYYASGQQGDFEIANRIIDGMNLWQKGGPDGKTRVEANAKLFSAIDGVLGQARVRMSPDHIRQQNNAIMADYIALTANDPDRKNIKEPELNQAILDVVGTKYNHRGLDTIIPRDIREYQFRNGVAAINADDTANLLPAGDGRPITAEVVRRSGQFVPVGDGRYQVYIPDPLKAGSTSQLIDGRTGRPWVVDIRPLIGRGATSQDLESGPLQVLPAPSGPRPNPFGMPAP